MTFHIETARALRLACLSAVIAFGCVAAQAANVSRNFNVTIDNNGTTIAGQTFSGIFSFNDSTGVPSGSETFFALNSFSFAFNGGSAGLGDLGYGDAVFRGGMFTGLDAVDLGGTFAFVPAMGGQSPYFAYDLGGGNAGNGSFRSSVVPEPGTAALALAALGLLGWQRRRKSRATAI